MPSLEVVPVRLRLRAPLQAAWGELTARDLLRVRLDWGDGDHGLGEAAPLEPYDGVPLAAVAAALEAYAAVLRDAAPDAEPGALLAACAAERPLPQALAAVDLALWDRAGRRAGRPIAQLLAAGAASSVPVNATLGAEDRAEAAAQAAAAVRAGFACVKVKVGIGDDAGRLAAMRATVGPEVAIRADANGAWGSPREALANLRALAPVGLELCEEPVHGLEALREVRAESPVPVAADESAEELSARAAGPGGAGGPRGAGWDAVDAVCLKISRCGGIGGVLRDAEAARAAGVAVYLASTFDGPAGIAAGLH
ncbi:MAG TPA: mandelate racemase/muconate lactonizing enzyme family protein, partial [Solirubrobacteraceae bacterium]|nr:mandelate racemase/muconate lactonizing enzyme family protein [Solirubrobacteraceae bacterium]